MEGTALGGIPTAFPPALFLHPLILQAGENQGVTFRDDELSKEELPSVFLLVNLAVTFQFFLRLSQQVTIKS
jgi:hypothetical protein